MWVCNSRTPSEFSDRLQEIVVSEQLQRYCEAVRPCPRCHRRRHLKDYRCRRFDTVFGRLGVRVPRFDGCRHSGELLNASPVPGLGRNASIVWIGPCCTTDRASEKEFLYLPYGDDFQERHAAHRAHLNSMKWFEPLRGSPISLPKDRVAAGALPCERSTI
jgi:hypothetical protein